MFILTGILPECSLTVFSVLWKPRSRGLKPFCRACGNSEMSEGEALMRTASVSNRLREGRYRGSDRPEPEMVFDNLTVRVLMRNNP